MASFCRSKTLAGEPCDCKEFSEPKQLNPSELERCAECGHGRSKHPSRKLQEAPVNTDNVTSIFKRHTEGLNDMLNLEDARSETLSGFRRTSGGSQGGSKGSSRLLGVNQIVLVVCGLGTDGKLKKQTAPGKIEISRLEKRGCAVLQLGNWDKPMRFDPAWTHEQVDAWLRELMPTPFKYLDSLPFTGPGKGKSASPKAAWVLLLKDRRNLDIAHKRASGKDLVRYKGRDNQGPGKSNIWIATRTEIPDNVLESWAEGESSEPEPAVTWKVKHRRESLGSESEGSIKTKRLRADFVVDAEKRGGKERITSKLFFSTSDDSEVSMVEETRIHKTARKGREQPRHLLSGPILVVRPSEEACLRHGNLRFMFYPELNEEIPTYNPWSDEYKIPRFSVAL